MLESLHFLHLIEIMTITGEFLMIKRERILSIDMNNEQSSQPHNNREHLSRHCWLHLFDALWYAKEKLLRNKKHSCDIYIQRVGEREEEKGGREGQVRAWKEKGVTRIR